jgi:hypothetical protein
MMRRRSRLLVWLGAAALVILLARQIAYALSPSPGARLLEHRAGGPALPVLALVSLALGASVAVVVCWLAALGVRERALLEHRRLAEAVPRFRAKRMLPLWLTLAIATSLGGGLFEAYIHWRAGLGWHGMECVVGPVHRDLLPIEGALSLIAAAVLAAAEHVLAWMRRTFALLRRISLRAVVPVRQIVAAGADIPAATLQLGTRAARAPPALS